MSKLDAVRAIYDLDIHVPCHEASRHRPAREEYSRKRETTSRPIREQRTRKTLRTQMSRRKKTSDTQHSLERTRRADVGLGLVVSHGHQPRQPVSQSMLIIDGGEPSACYLAWVEKCFCVIDERWTGLSCVAIYARPPHRLHREALA